MSRPKLVPCLLLLFVLAQGFDEGNVYRIKLIKLSTQTSTPPPGLSPGAIAGIVAGSVVGAGAIAGGIAGGIASHESQKRKEAGMITTTDALTGLMAQAKKEEAAQDGPSFRNGGDPQFRNGGDEEPKSSISAEISGLPSFGALPSGKSSSSDSGSGTAWIWALLFIFGPFCCFFACMLMRMPKKKKSRKVKKPPATEVNPLLTEYPVIETMTVPTPAVPIETVTMPATYMVAPPVVETVTLPSLQTQLVEAPMPISYAPTPVTYAQAPAMIYSGGTYAAAPTVL